MVLDEINCNICVLNNISVNVACSELLCWHREDQKPDHTVISSLFVLLPFLPHAFHSQYSRTSLGIISVPDFPNYKTE